LSEDAVQLRSRLKEFGISDSAIHAAWPKWWSSEAESSPSARAELRFSIARNLGLDPHWLLSEKATPRFVWRNSARFKHLTGESEIQQSVISSFGVAIGRIILGGIRTQDKLDKLDPLELRETVLKNRPFIEIADLLSICWSFSIPVIHLRLFPFLQKRMTAMTVRIGSQYVILLAKDFDYPPFDSFYLAHELGHIMLGHLKENDIIVDLENEVFSLSVSDSEEIEADAYALSVLTGQPDPIILSNLQSVTGRGLAEAALKVSSQLKIEPGSLALCFGYSTGNWESANAAMRSIYTTKKPVWKEVNNLALHELSLDEIPDDSRDYLRSVLGMVVINESSS
jgi:hypothetical protein